jgi:hypothetical protein
MEGILHGNINESGATFSLVIHDDRRDPISIFCSHAETIVRILERMKSECPIKVSLSTNTSFDGGWWNYAENVYSGVFVLRRDDDFEQKVKCMIEDVDSQLREEDAFLSKDHVWKTNDVKLHIRNILDIEQPRAKKPRLE